MPFGQPTGPPASARQLQELLALVRAAGHLDFRDARGPLGLTQRQAAGRFTREEAAALIEQLEDPEQAVAVPEGPAPPGAAVERALRRMPAEHLAAELQRRGWIVIDP